MHAHIWRKEDIFRKRRLNSWQNSITVFGVLALCTIKIDHIRARAIDQLFLLNIIPNISSSKFSCKIVFLIVLFHTPGVLCCVNNLIETPPTLLPWATNIFYTTHSIGTGENFIITYSIGTGKTLSSPTVLEQGEHYHHLQYWRNRRRRKP